MIEGKKIDREGEGRGRELREEAEKRSERKKPTAVHACMYGAR